MFSLVFGALALVLAVIFRDWSNEAELIDDYEAAGMYAILAFCSFVAMVVFLVAGVVGL